MIFTVPMKLLYAAILAKDVQTVSDELLKLGVLDAVSVRELSEIGTKLKAQEQDPELDTIKELRRRVEGFLQLAPMRIARPDPSVYVGTPVPSSKDIEKQFDTFASQITGIRERQKEIQEQILKLDEIRRQIELYKAGGTEIFANSAFLTVKSGTVNESSWTAVEKALSSLPVVIIPGEQALNNTRFIVVVMLKRDESRVIALLQKYGWSEQIKQAIDTTATANSLADLENKRKKLTATLDECAQSFNRLFEDHGSELAEIWSKLRAAELSGAIRSSFAKTASTALITGWIPEKDMDRVEKGIRTASNNCCYIEWLTVEDAEKQGLKPPTEIKNPHVLAPFQTLVTNYGVPQYGAIDPTAFVAISYLTMFGLMFGDAGHGLVLCIAGLLWFLRSKKNNSSTTLGLLIVYCGISAIISGLLFGSIFGYALLPPLWFPYHRIINGEPVTVGGVRSVYDILGITIKFGMIVLGTGLILNWINLARKKNWITLVFDKAGLVGGWIYAAGAWVAFYFVNHNYKALPPVSSLLFLLIVPTCLLALKAPLEHIAEKKHGSQHASHVHESRAMRYMNYFMEWIVSILEVYSGYLANTLSFMRVAGLGIAHVSLMTAFFQIANMVNPTHGFSIVSLIILIVGNVLVIALEGLSAGIQSLRLNYYEFFSKYFNGTGRAYSPITIKAK
ncbi:MAG TPA: V-type ATPase 116kDa subunit family protein [Spirochaetales bacterium]|nr:V-type ATPase 116kDa subunit family protein [Spirochaetales bacterium]HOT58075.1 V-type ATPase 116kDa subunit family protein [Spirochaetales bacterium]HQG40092.1 V-type ATPase 116kDa subunit family protein [Spirochaetales bacterium]HQK33791.1 V-type ATPase 116kDa subunit family protein [Spirochaetales bacterium]